MRIEYKREGVCVGVVVLIFETTYMYMYKCKCSHFLVWSRILSKWVFASHGCAVCQCYLGRVSPGFRLGECVSMMPVSI